MLNLTNQAWYGKIPICFRQRFEEVKHLKIGPRIEAVVAIFLLCLIVCPISLYKQFNKQDTKENDNKLLLSNNILESTSDDLSTDSMESNSIENDENKTENDDIVYDGLTKNELIDKLNRNLNSTLSGTGELFANYSLALGIDPYLAVAIVLHETGCSWDCSDLVKYCYNVGGQKGAPGCFGGSYAAFSSLEEGIESYMNNLYKNYYALGLTTPEEINPKYASSTTWASKVNYYINKIKAS
jgi:hypothetical protein